MAIVLSKQFRCSTAAWFVVLLADLRSKRSKAVNANSSQVAVPMEPYSPTA